MTFVDLSSVALSSTGNVVSVTAELSAGTTASENQQQQEHAGMRRAEAERSVACSCMALPYKTCKACSAFASPLI
jgi:hypothetical protein